MRDSLCCLCICGHKDRTGDVCSRRKGIMKDVLIIESGISGMACAVRCASHGLHVTLLSPFLSGRSQSVMAAGGINAVLQSSEEGIPQRITLKIH